MAETWDEQQLIADGFERVYVDLEWYDGPRKGLAVIDGVPHYFEGCDFDHADEADEYSVWPASEAAVEMEREQWAIFARWNERNEPRRSGRIAIRGTEGSMPATTNWLCYSCRTVSCQTLPGGSWARCGSMPAPATGSMGSTTGSGGVRAGEAAVDH
ncbi:hypothetical protein ACWEQL_21215 [Kitasatospora sp. NPDC004240]